MTVASPPLPAADGPVESAASGGASRANSSLLPVAVIGAAAAYAAWRIVGPKSGLDWYYDEMWRVDILRRDGWRAIYVAEATPVTALWFFVLRALLRPLFLQPAPTRAVAGLLLALGPAGVGALALAAFRGVRLPGRTGVAGDRLQDVGAAVAVLLLVSAGRFCAEIGSYVNPYLFEAGAGLGGLAWIAASEPGRPLPRAPRVALVILGTATIGGLFLVPAIGIALLWRALRMEGPDRRRELVLHAATFGLLGVMAGASYVGMYSSGGTRGATKEFFAEQQFQGGVLDLPEQYYRFVTGSLDWNGPFASMRPLALALLVLGVLAVGRSRPLIVGSLASGILLCIVASPMTGWPAIAYRVNATMVLGLSTLVAVGLVMAVRAVLSIHWETRWATTAAAAGAALVALTTWTPQSVEPPYEFARGLTHDLEAVAASPYEKNLVVSYHFMSKWYAHDRLITGHRDDEPAFDLIGDRLDDRLLYERLPEVVEQRADPHTAVWCVMPWEVGPADFPLACRLDGTGREQVVLPKGERAQVVLWKPLTP